MLKLKIFKSGDAFLSASPDFFVKEWILIKNIRNMSFLVNKRCFCIFDFIDSRRKIV